MGLGFVDSPKLERRATVSKSSWKKADLDKEPAAQDVNKVKVALFQLDDPAFLLWGKWSHKHGGSPKFLSCLS